MKREASRSNGYCPKRLRMHSSSQMDGEPAYLQECHRPLPPSLNSSTDSLVFMYIDIATQDEKGGKDSTNADLHKITQAGNSILRCVKGLEHYFYVPARGMDASAFQIGLEEALKKDGRRYRVSGNLVKSIEEVKKRSIRYYIPGDPELKSFKVRVAVPALVREAMSLLQSGSVKLNGKSVGELQTFDATVDFKHRFLIEWDLKGCSWVDLKKGEFNVVNDAKKKSLAQIEVIVNWKDAIVYKREGEWLRTAPIRRLSFDIESL